MNERLAIDSLGIRANDPGMFDNAEFPVVEQQVSEVVRPVVPTPAVVMAKASIEKFEEHLAQDWRHKAACADGKTDLELFFPPGTRGASNESQIEEAKAVCRNCEVRRDCLATALEGKEQGVWGGTTDEEREALRRRNRRSVR